MMRPGFGHSTLPWPTGSQANSTAMSHSDSLTWRKDWSDTVHYLKDGTWIFNKSASFLTGAQCTLDDEMVLYTLPSLTVMVS